ncbi:HNH endonuclease [Rhodococcus phage GuyFagieri]|nr:HNH endonuclease [Rhodococcus phage GuyFagieri]
MRAPKTCSWRSEDGRDGCAKTAVRSPSGEDFRCEAHWRTAWQGQSDRRRRVPALTDDEKRFVRERDFGVCRDCGAPAHEVDHIVEVADGGDNRPSNLQLLCDYHHAQKTRNSQEAWKSSEVRRGTSSRAKAKRRTRERGLYQQ